MFHAFNEDPQCSCSSEIWGITCPYLLGQHGVHTLCSGTEMLGRNVV